MQLSRFLEIEGAMLRRFRAACEQPMSDDELADFAEMDAEYEAEMDRLAELGITRDSIIGPNDRDGDVLIPA